MTPKGLKLFDNTLDTLMSMVRMLVLTKFRKTIQIDRKHSSCLVMGNGPSLIQSLEENKVQLESCDLMAVNFMATSPQYSQYKPSVYLLCDPNFWFEQVDEAKRQQIIDFYQVLIETTAWPVQFYMPYQAKKVKTIMDLLSQNEFINVIFYNKTKIEGFSKLKHWAYDRQWGMPRAQNVVIAALMIAIHSEYECIYLAGSENDTLKNLWVDNDNHLRIHDPHFYAESQVFKDRIINCSVHEYLLKMYFTFKSYMNVAAYVSTKNVKVINISPNSFIDAFEKKERVNS